MVVARDAEIVDLKTTIAKLKATIAEKDLEIDRLTAMLTAPAMAMAN